MSAECSVAVRMYRGLLGDCFLLRIRGADKSASHVLIDCGILQGVDKASERMVAIAEDIEKATGGVLDLVIVTHQHHDHISGFGQARHILLDPERMKIRELWMAWTEDPFDDDANRLREDFSRRKFAIASFASALRASGGRDRVSELTEDLDKFIGPVELGTGPLGAAPTGRLTGDRIMDELKRVAQRVRFLSPGQVIELPGAAPLPTAVLGPPRSTSRLFKDLPSKGANKETYIAEELFTWSFLAMDSGSASPNVDLETPFARRFSKGLEQPGSDEDVEDWARDEGSVHRWLFDHYYAPADSREGRTQGYRRIDSEWTGTPSALALKLDSDTNNTSLVLAMRLPDGSFLLFVGDAQVGNWLSWHDQEYDFGDERLTAEQILGRTRLYKVGHHASHNATLRQRGLELMTHPELVAMVSTDEAVAEQQGKPPGWQMPDDEVKAALLKRCEGRLIRGDRDWATDTDVEPFRAAEAGFQNQLDEKSPLFVEFNAFAGSSPPARTKPSRGRASMDEPFSLDETKRFVARLDLPAAPLGGTAPDLVFDKAKQQAMVVGSDVLSFDVGVEADFREALTHSALLAQLAAEKQLGANPDPIAYFDTYFGFVGRLGWVTQVRDVAHYEITTDGAKVHQAILEVVTAFIGNIPGAAALVALTLKQLQAMDRDSPLITLFYRESENAQVGRFQFTTIRQDGHGGLFAEVMGFALDADKKITKVLFFELNKTRTRLRRALGTMSLNRAAIQGILPAVRARAQAHLAGNVAQLEL